MKINLVLSLLLLICFSPQAQVPGLEKQSPWSYDGYIKYMASAFVLTNTNNSVEHLVHNRINLAYQNSNDSRFNFSLRNRLIVNQASQNAAYRSIISYDPGYFDLSKNWLEQHDYILNSQIDRAFWSKKLNQHQLRLGRQRINWAMATLFNPNDVFNAYSIYDFDYEEGPGSDGLLYSYFEDYATQFDIALTNENAAHSSSAVLRARSNYLDSDWQLIAGLNRDRWVLGSGFSGDIYKSSIRGEWSYFTKTKHNPELSPASHVATLESESLLRPESNLMLRLSALYISNPLPASRLSVLSQRVDARRLSFSRWTGFIGLGFDITALSRLELSSSYYSDQSYYFGLSNTWSLADEWELLAIGQWFDGLDQDSTFTDNSGGQFSLRVKWSF